MKSVVLRGLALSALMVALGSTGGAQQAPAAANDPRIGLKPGLKDAGVAARHMELVSTMPKPDGFFDPKDPLGPITPPETPPTPAPAGTAAAPTTPAATSSTGRDRGDGCGATAERARLRQLRSGLHRQSRRHGELQRVQHL